MFDNRKLLSTMLAASMATMLIPIAASADPINTSADETDAGIVLLAENTPTMALSDLQSQINAYPNATITVTGVINITQDTTLDLNNCTVQSTGDYPVFNVTSGTLTVKGGTVKGTSKTTDGYSAICVSGNNAKVVVDGATTVQGVNRYGIAIFNEAKLDVYGYVVSDNQAAISGNGTQGAGGTAVTIKSSAQVTSVNDVAIYHPQTGTLTVEAGLITGGKSGIEVKAGTVTIQGGVISGGSMEGSITANHNGSSSQGYDVVAVEDTAYPENSSKKIIITGGTFTKNPDASYIADGYTANLKTTSGKYVVEKSATGDVQGTATSSETTSEGTLLTTKVNDVITQTVLTKTDGTVVTTTYERNADGSYTTTTTVGGSDVIVYKSHDANNNVTAVKVEIPSTAVANGKATVPVSIDAANKSAAPVVTISAPAGTEVTIPVGADSSTIVAVDKATGNIVKVSPTATKSVVVKTDTAATNSAFAIIKNNKSFEDIKGNEWYANSVARITAKEIMNGMGPDYKNFAPNENTSRAMMAQIVYNMANATDTSDTTKFTDATSGWYTSAIKWASDKGIVTGYGDGKGGYTGEFGPDVDVTREQAITMLWRYAGSPTEGISISALDKFEDNGKYTDYAKMALAWAAQNNILQGRNDKTIEAESLATRAEIATLVQRFADAGFLS